MMINITKEEAQALRFLFQHVGGNPTTTGRGLISSVSYKLGEVMRSRKVPEPTTGQFAKFPGQMGGSFYFAVPGSNPLSYA